jgi:HAMP domain-containing protein
MRRAALHNCSRPGLVPIIVGVSMRLLLKFNLAFLVVFALGLAAAGAVSWNLLRNNAMEEVSQNARVMMEAASATRAYTAAQIQPLLADQMKEVFLPQSVPAYAATEIFAGVRKTFPEYSYKEAVLNPTNPRDRAVEWEADIINRFRNGHSAKEIVGERESATGRSFYVAHPIKITNPACLSCHTTPDIAPPKMIERYGPSNGFGWKLNEIVGAQVIEVPTTVPLQRAAEAFKVFMLSIAGVFLAIGVVLNLMLTMIVIRPVTRLSALADQVSMGDMEAPEFNARGRDEIATLAASFGRMRKSLAQAMKMLDE